MREHSDFQAFLEVLSETLANIVFFVLDVAATIAVIKWVVDDWKELCVVLTFLLVTPVVPYLIFKKQRATIGRLRNRITELEATEANIYLEVVESGFEPSGTRTTRSFPEIKVYPYGFDEQGLPGWGVIWAKLKVTNTGYETGKLVWDFDRSKTKLPPLFDPDFATSVSSYIKPHSAVSIKARDSSQQHLLLDVRIAEREREAFARSLSSLDSYRVTIVYHTERTDGESEPRPLVIEGDFQEFRRRILDHWRHSKHCDLTQIAESH